MTKDIEAPPGLTEAAASGELPPKPGRAIGQRTAARTGPREHALAVVDAVIAFHQAEAADRSGWQLEVAHPTPPQLASRPPTLWSSWTTAAAHS
ncbi:hypothetical protein [Streptomyces sp. NPDC052036]|uniref:hypothetical protein n=1 Tax=Streptomyces sp. NPDC052036 TaxID=3155171 RepID=UPI00343A28ED